MTNRRAHRDPGTEGGAAGNTAEGVVDVAVGVDAGGTATRALVVDAHGRVLGSARAGGGNPHSHPPDQAAASVVEAMAEAVGSAAVGPARVRACVVGMAGHSKLTDPGVADVFDQAWASLDTRLGRTPATRPRVVSDAEAAFASATSSPDGTVLVAGTGSIAGRIRGRRMVSTAGGYGWLLGDEGSGFWIGRQAVRATLDALVAAEPLPRLARLVLAEAGIEPHAGRVAHRLITAVNGEPPVRLARFAPLVSAADAEGDTTARAIVEQAAKALTATALAAREPGERTPVVLVGSVLGESSPVGVRVRAALHAAHREPPHTAHHAVEVVGSDDGVLGAAWLAALDAFGPDTPRPKRVPWNLAPGPPPRRGPLPDPS